MATKSSQDQINQSQASNDLILTLLNNQNQLSNNLLAQTPAQMDFFGQQNAANRKASTNIAQIGADAQVKASELAANANIQAAKFGMQGQIGAANAAARGAIGAAKENARGVIEASRNQAWATVEASANAAGATKFAATEDKLARLGVAKYQLEGTKYAADAQKEASMYDSLQDRLASDFSSVQNTISTLGAADSAARATKQASFNQYLASLAQGEAANRSAFIQGGMQNISTMIGASSAERVATTNARAAENTAFINNAPRYVESFNNADAARFNALSNIARESLGTADNTPLFAEAMRGNASTVGAAINSLASTSAALANERASNLNSFVQGISAPLAPLAGNLNSWLAANANENVATTNLKAEAVKSSDQLIASLAKQSSDEAIARTTTEGNVAVAEKNRMASMYGSNNELAGTMRMAGSQDLNSKLTNAANLAANTNTTNSQNFNTVVKAAVDLADQASRERVAEIAGSYQVATAAAANNGGSVNNPYSQAIGGLLAGRRTNNSFNFSGVTNA